MDIERKDNTIKIGMNDYANSLEEIKEFRDVKKDDSLTKLEYKIYRKYTGKLSWLADNVRPDLCHTVLEMSRKNNSANMGDLKNVNRVLEKVRNKENILIFKKLGNNEELCMYGITDASFHQDKKSIAGNMLILGNQNNDDAVPLYWKSKSIDRVCESSKDAEARAMNMMIDVGKQLTEQIEQLLSKKNPELKKKNIPIKIFTDNIPVLKSIASTTQSKNRYLRPTYAKFKENLEFKEIDGFSWIDGRKMLADVLTKEKSHESDTGQEMNEIMEKNLFKYGKTEDNLVLWKKGEIMLLNPKEKDETEEKNELERRQKEFSKESEEDTTKANFQKEEKFE